AADQQFAFGSFIVGQQARGGGQFDLPAMGDGPQPEVGGNVTRRAVDEGIARIAGTGRPGKQLADVAGVEDGAVGVVVEGADRALKHHGVAVTNDLRVVATEGNFASIAFGIQNQARGSTVFAVQQAQRAFDGSVHVTPRG